MNRLALLRLPVKKFTSPLPPAPENVTGPFAIRGDVLAGAVGLDFAAKLEGVLAVQYGDVIEDR